MHCERKLLSSFNDTLAVYTVYLLLCFKWFSDKNDQTSLCLASVNIHDSPLFIFVGLSIGNACLACLLIDGVCLIRAFKCIRFWIRMLRVCEDTQRTPTRRITRRKQLPETVPYLYCLHPVVYCYIVFLYNRQHNKFRNKSILLY
jgi:hypothetical protein